MLKHRSNIAQTSLKHHSYGAPEEVHAGNTPVTINRTLVFIQLHVHFFPGFLMQFLQRLALLVALLGVAMLAASGMFTRWGVWDYRFGLTLLRYSAYVGMAAAVLSLLAFVISRPRGGALILLSAALLIGAATFGLPWSLQRTARSVPPIHDISTDTNDPPRFVDVLPLRLGARNGSDYAGDSIAQLQRAAYPDMQPIQLPVTSGEAFTKAYSAAERMGWDIAGADSASGRIEATATTTWFGFKDDVVIRVRGDGSGSRVDIRSMSRVGRSDVGANAARIRAYRQELVANQ